MAIIKNPITIVQTGGGGVDITAENIAAYKFQDIADANLNGGKIATDAEYESAETYLQTLYNLILNGGSNE